MLVLFFMPTDELMNGTPAHHRRDEQCFVKRKTFNTLFELVFRKFVIEGIIFTKFRIFGKNFKWSKKLRCIYCTYTLTNAYTNWYRETETCLFLNNYIGTSRYIFVCIYMYLRIEVDRFQSNATSKVYLIFALFV